MSEFCKCHINDNNYNFEHICNICKLYRQWGNCISCLYEGNSLWNNINDETNEFICLYCYETMFEAEYDQNNEPNNELNSQSDNESNNESDNESKSESDNESNTESNSESDTESDNELDINDITLILKKILKLQNKKKEINNKIIELKKLLKNNI
jgi:hypothetical protein